MNKKRLVIFRLRGAVQKHIRNVRKLDTNIGQLLWQSSFAPQPSVTRYELYLTLYLSLTALCILWQVVSIWDVEIGESLQGETADRQNRAE